MPNIVVITKQLVKNTVLVIMQSFMIAIIAYCSSYNIKCTSSAIFSNVHIINRLHLTDEGHTICSR